jgi:hypothetical protein
MIAVIFEVVPHPAQRQDYLEAAALLRPQLEAMDGFVLVRPRPIRAQRTAEGHASLGGLRKRWIAALTMPSALPCVSYCWRR